MSLTKEARHVLNVNGTINEDKIGTVRTHLSASPKDLAWSIALLSWYHAYLADLHEPPRITIQDKALSY